MTMRGVGGIPSRRRYEIEQALETMLKIPLWLIGVAGVLVAVWLVLPASAAAALTLVAALAAGAALLVSPAVVGLAALAAAATVAGVLIAGAASVALIPPILAALLCIALTAAVRRAVPAVQYAYATARTYAAAATERATAGVREMAARVDARRRAVRDALAAAPEAARDWWRHTSHGSGGLAAG